MMFRGSAKLQCKAAKSLLPTGRMTIMRHLGRQQGRSILVRGYAATVEQPNAQKFEDNPTLASIGSSGSVPVSAGKEGPVGSLEDKVFRQDWSVNFWRDFRIPEDIRDANTPVSSRVQALARTLQEATSRAGVFNSTQSLAYWAYHVSRMSYFATQGLAGVLYSNYKLQQDTNGSSSPSSSSTPSSSSSSSGRKDSGFDLSRLLTSGMYVPISESLAMFYQDYENVRRGNYKLPWDMTTPGHKQANPFNILRTFSRFVREAGLTLERRAAGKPDPVWLESGLYPSYYLNSWHYQTDGWLSDESAKVYEASTETVFLGRQDAMQRQSLLPMKEFMDRRGSVDGRGMSMLEVACGTGRFATFVKDNYPGLAITQSDLSPFYLQEARKNMDYWRKKRAGSSAPAVDRFLQAPAEKLPVPDNSFDVVSSTYLFHELPHESREKAIVEMARVVRPGGVVIFNDGLQMGDRPIGDAVRGSFQAFNEPNWGTHITLDYGAMFKAVGLTPDMKVLASGSKMLSFTKPAHSA